MNKIETTATAAVRKDSYITRTFYCSPGDSTEFIVCYSYNTHKRQKEILEINRRLRYGK